MWFFKKKEENNELIKKLVDVVTAMNMSILELDKEVDLIKARLKHKVFREEEHKSNDTNIDELIRAFGGDLPIELAEKYKNRD